MHARMSYTDLRASITPKALNPILSVPGRITPLPADGPIAHWPVMAHTLTREYLIVFGALRCDVAEAKTRTQAFPRAGRK